MQAGARPDGAAGSPLPPTSPGGRSIPQPALAPCPRAEATSAAHHQRWTCESVLVFFQILVVVGLPVLIAGLSPAQPHVPRSSSLRRRQGLARLARAVGAAWRTAEAQVAVFCGRGDVDPLRLALLWHGLLSLALLLARVAAFRSLTAAAAASEPLPA